jgi:hypothetical protein
MKQYHTQIVIQAPITRVWAELTNFKAYPEWNPLVRELHGELEVGSKIRMFIIPFGSYFNAEFLTVAPNQEMSWQGVRFAKFLLSGRHYYKLEAIDDNKTRLLHGEFFEGWFSGFISSKTLKMMETIFVVHNELFKKRVENNV